MPARLAGWPAKVARPCTSTPWAHRIWPIRAKLLASAQRIYGEEMDRLWGETVASAGRAGTRPGRRRRDRCRWAAHRRPLTRPATPGTTWLICWTACASPATWPPCACPAYRHVRVPTPPPEIDLPAWRRSLARLAELHPDRLLPTHFGPVEVDSLAHLQEVEDHLAAAAAFVQERLAGGSSPKRLSRPSSHGSPSEHWPTASTLTPLRASR